MRRAPRHVGLRRLGSEQRRQNQEKALRLLVEALTVQDLKERGAFWRENVLADRGLWGPLRDHPEFARLDARYSRPAR